MGEIIQTLTIKRESGYLYYCGTNSQGYLTVCKAKMARGKKEK